MHKLLLSTTVLCAALLAASSDAWAHGGGSFRGPGGVVPPRARSLRCDCAQVTCSFCGSAHLEKLADVSTRSALTKTVEAWGDLVQVETRVRFETRRSRGFVEGHAVIRHAPLFAATAGRVEIGDGHLEARLGASAGARRDYLWERRRNRDPLLVLRVDAGAVQLRVFPIARKQATFAVVRGYALSDEVGRKGVRVYRTGTSYLAVVPLGSVGKDEEPDFIDRGGDRALFFVDQAEARKRYGAAARKAREVPCVQALRCAVHDDGVDAVTRHAALVAVPKGGGAPKDLSVGESGPAVPPPPPGREPEPTRPPSPRELIPPGTGGVAR